MFCSPKLTTHQASSTKILSFCLSKLFFFSPSFLSICVLLFFQLIPFVAKEKAFNLKTILLVSTVTAQYESNIINKYVSIKKKTIFFYDKTDKKIKKIVVYSIEINERKMKKCGWFGIYVVAVAVIYMVKLLLVLQRRLWACIKIQILFFSFACWKGIQIGINHNVGFNGNFMQKWWLKFENAFWFIFIRPFDGFDDYLIWCWHYHFPYKRNANFARFKFSNRLLIY